jgi:hypothetical protein
MRASAAVLAFVSLIVLAGCSQPPAGPSEAAGPGPADGVRPTLVAPTFSAPVRLGTVSSAEPNLVAGPGDALYVTTPLHLWRSQDGGKTFEEMGEPGPCTGACPLLGRSTKEPGLDGGGDGDLAGDGNGTLYWAGLFGDSGPLPFQVSRDGGQSWSKPVSLAPKDNGTDREWIDARPDGHVFVVWRDFGDGSADAAANLLFASSPDRGATWETRAITKDHLGGPIVHDPSSDALYMPYYDEVKGVVVAASGDLGRTWSLRPVGSQVATPSEGSNGGSHIFPVAAVDAAGTVYAVWSVDEPAAVPANEATVPAVKMAVSKDHGATWSKPFALSTPDRTAIFPWVVAGAPGRVAVAWYENRLGMPSDVAPDAYDVVLKESVDADAAAPTFLGGAVNRDPVHVGWLGTENPYRTADRTLLDYFEVALQPDGHPAVVWVGDSDLHRVNVDVFVATVESGTPLA